jgi:hypothetical protein
MADQASGYVQRKIDLARRTAIQEKIAAARAASCCPTLVNSQEDAGTNSGYLYARMQEMPQVPSLRRGISASAHLQGCVDGLNEWIRENDRFEAVSQRIPIPACTTPANTIYNLPTPFFCSASNMISSAFLST